MMHKLNEVYKVDCCEYADDICVFSESKEELHFILSVIREELNLLKLTLKGNYQIFPIAKNKYDKSGRALDYVGYLFYRNQKLIRKKIKKTFCRVCAKLNKNKRIKEKEYKQRVSPWLGWAKHSNSKNLIKRIIKPEYYESVLH